MVNRQVIAETFTVSALRVTCQCWVHNWFLLPRSVRAGLKYQKIKALIMQKDDPDDSLRVRHFMLRWVDVKLILLLYTIR